MREEIVLVNARVALSKKLRFFSMLAGRGETFTSWVNSSIDEAIAKHECEQKGNPNEHSVSLES